ncbi:MAG: glutamine--tRNA ligase/YqeY domain fusion protein [Desulfarculaceae bacterium]|nr:glutamine--tRNA ligase/YqeY domain fusion protein [Desulfarculaceae bacterium]MCF8071729.1 glutamine--tRNA ligase/YqeY domain fusion protein [Desulfarculaceae bacterium]MCF8102424.1 glutamine--tRNA ligase/YqeY domain fusion protein [Desulfarculaceae bacterium]MCF8116766.1 glutamine--tRNA ligase/YqeY domain fusion protein [Desulfarculaceae bacterium]
MAAAETPAPTNFIRNIIDEHNKNGRFDGRVVTRFPPEPNGYLHIGHAKSICLNFGLARDYQGRCHLRFDDTNPAKEEQEYIDSIMDDVRWLGFDWGEHLYYASNYFDQLYEFALKLIRGGKAYVDDLSAEEIRAHRGTLTEPGKDSPYRGRSVEENLELFTGMKDGQFPDGSRVLRAKIDMAHPNLVMRDPTLYRIRRVIHHRTGDKWCIYPMYDFTHCISDSIEQITHSICTLEFEDNRALYDWVLNQLEVYHPQQIEFARLNLEFAVMSKRKLLELVKDGHVDGWDDPRMLTIRGMRRRGFTPASVRLFCERIGVGKKESWIDMYWLEKAVRDDLNPKVPRVMGVLDPIKVVLTNYPEDQEEFFEAPFFPDDPPAMGSRKVPFCRELLVERDDFMEVPAKKFWRLAPGREVRLRWAYFITCDEVIKDADGNIVELRCTYDPATKGGDAPDGRKVKGTLHWVSARHGVPATVRLYDRLFTVPNPDADKTRDYKEFLNPESRVDMPGAVLEPVLAEAEPDTRYQFERKGYFYVDPADSAPGKPVFNRIVTLRDSWAKIVEAAKREAAAQARAAKKKKKQQKNKG